MKNKIAITILFISLTMNSQHKSLGVSFNSGISIIPNPLLENLTHGDGFENNLGLSGDIGLYYTHYFSLKSLIEIDLLYTLISSNETHNIAIHDMDNSTINYRKIKYQKRNYYITIPIKYGLEYNEFIYTLGAQISVNMNNFLESEGNSFDKPENYKETIKYDRYEKIDFGINIGIEKKIYNRIILGLKYYHGLNNLEDDIISKNRQLTFGIKYELYRKLL